MNRNAIAPAALEVAAGQQPRWQQRIPAPSLDDRERTQQEHTTRCGADNGRGAPAQGRTFNEGIHEQGDAGGGAERAGQVERACPVARVVAGYQRKREQRRQTGQWHVDEEDRLPPERLGEHTTKKDADDESRRAGPSPDRQRAIALGAFGKRGVDQRKRRREDECASKALRCARHQQNPRRRREPTRQRRTGVQPRPVTKMRRRPRRSFYDLLSRKSLHPATMAGAAVFSGLKLGGVLLLAPSRLGPWLVRAMVAVVS